MDNYKWKKLSNYLNKHVSFVIFYFRLLTCQKWIFSCKFSFHWLMFSFRLNELLTWHKKLLVPHHNFNENRTKNQQNKLNFLSKIQLLLFYMFGKFSRVWRKNAHTFMFFWKYHSVHYLAFKSSVWITVFLKWIITKFSTIFRSYNCLMSKLYNIGICSYLITLSCFRISYIII